MVSVRGLWTERTVAILQISFSVHYLLLSIKAQAYLFRQTTKIAAAVEYSDTFFRFIVLFPSIWRSATGHDSRDDSLVIASSAWRACAR